MNLPAWFHYPWTVSILVRHERGVPLKQVFNRNFATEDEALTFQQDELDLARYEPYVEIVTALHKRELIERRTEVRP